MGKKGFGIVLLILAVTMAVFATAFPSDPTYIITDGLTQIEVNGRFETVADIIENSDVTLLPQDIVNPDRSSPPPENKEITIIRARSVTIRQGSQLQSYWTQQTNILSFLDEIGIVPQPGDEIRVDGEPISVVQLRNQPLPQLIEIGRAETVTIIDGAQQQLLFTTAKTVADALLEAGIPVDGSIIVTPPLTTLLEANMVIKLQRGILLTIVVDGRTESIRTSFTTPQQILAEANILLSELDYTKPALDEPVAENGVIQLIRVVEETRFEDTEIAYQTVWQGSSELDLDTQAIISTGQAGIFRREIRVRFENGVEVSQTLAEEGVIQEPINEVFGYGTHIAVSTINTNEGPRDYWRIVRMRVTSYTAASSGKAPDDPAYGITASGLPAGYGIVAIDRNVVPFRSELYVPGYGVAFAGDTGGGVRGRWIDLGYEEDTFVSWSGYVDVYYLTPVPAPEDINYILPAGLP